jgi:DNA-binding response OmpR family regulator
MKVLIADDDRDQLAIRELLLARFGFEAITATNSRSALQKAIAERPACAVIDLRLPTEESGLGLIRQLKAWNAHLHVLVLTGTREELLEKLPERSLIDGVIMKGSSSAALINRLKKLEAEGCLG